MTIPGSVKGRLAKAASFALNRDGDQHRSRFCRMAVGSDRAAVYALRGVNDTERLKRRLTTANMGGGPAKLRN
jgi:hypothetical protein